MYKYIIISCLR